MENNEGASVEPTNNAEGVEEPKQQADVMTLSREDYDKLNEQIGSLKRDLKKANNAKDTKKSTNEPKQENNEFGLLEHTFLKGEGITDEATVDFVKEQMKESGKDLVTLFNNNYFKAELESFKTDQANKLASSNVEGGGGDNNAKNTSEYWIAKGVPPTREDVPDRKTRAKIARAFISNQKSSKTFYND